MMRSLAFFYIQVMSFASLTSPVAGRLKLKNKRHNRSVCCSGEQKDHVSCRNAEDVLQIQLIWTRGRKKNGQIRSFRQICSHWTHYKVTSKQKDDGHLEKYKSAVWLVGNIWINYTRPFNIVCSSCCRHVELQQCFKATKITLKI